MKATLSLLFVIILIISCSEKGTENTGENNSVPIPDNIFPMKVGSEWTFLFYMPNSHEHFRSFTFKCIKDTVVNNEKWFGFDLFPNDSSDITGDIGLPAINVRYYKKRVDGIYAGFLSPKEGFKELMMFPTNGKKYNFSSVAFATFDSKQTTTVMNELLETYKFVLKVEGGYNITYFAEDIGIVYQEVVETDSSIKRKIKLNSYKFN